MNKFENHIKIMLIIIKKYSIRMNKIWNNLSVVSKLLISFVVTVVIVIGVSAMIFWGKTN